VTAANGQQFCRSSSRKDVDGGLQTADCRVGTGIFVAEKLAGEDA